MEMPQRILFIRYTKVTMTPKVTDWVDVRNKGVLQNCRRCMGTLR